jgi:hypothetical protein
MSSQLRSSLANLVGREFWKGWKVQLARQAAQLDRREPVRRRKIKYLVPGPFGAPKS